jgi:hypothetical protein
VAGDEIRERLSERLPRTRLAEAAKSPDAQPKTDRAVADGQVGRRAGVETVDAPRALAALRADGAAGLAARVDDEVGRVGLHGVKAAAGDTKRDDGGGHEKASR